MAPSTTQLAQQLRQFIWYHLDNDLVDNARFLAGRLYALDNRNPDSVHILALCYFRSGQYKTAYDYSRAHSLSQSQSQRREHLGCAYVFAQACLMLERYAEGVSVLEKTRLFWESKPPCCKADAQRRPSPDAAAFHCILGKLAQGSGDVKKAVESYVAALKLNPFMWDAFERLCDTGASIRPQNIFKESHLSASFLQAFDMGQPQNGNIGPNGTNNAPSMQPPNSRPSVQIEVTHATDPFNPTKPMVEPKQAVNDFHIRGGVLNGVTTHGPSLEEVTMMETPPAFIKDDTLLGLAPPRAGQQPPAEPPNAPLRRSRTQAFATETQQSVDVGKAKSIPGKHLSKEGSGESTDPQEIVRSSLYLPRTTKRTISGNDPNSRMQPPLDPTNPGQRRSVRLFRKAPTNSTIPGPKEGEPDLKKVKATGTRGRTAATSTVGRIVSGNRKPLEHPPMEHPKIVQHQPPLNAQTAAPAPLAKPSSATDPPMPQRPRSTIATGEATSALPQLIKHLVPLALAYHSLSRHDPQKTIADLSSLSSSQRDTPYVLSLLGRAHYDLNAYGAAVSAFAKVRSIEPSQTKHMEIYSTALWHLKNDTELAFLSHELVETQRSAPQSWCALGNAFSLQREHENAIKCFKRATQLDPRSAYAWTLLGHEQVSAEDLEKAAHAYRKAVTVDRRHYQGWYGLGRVYERSGRNDMAERHYRVASSINPRNSVLLCCVGTVQDRTGRHAEALATYEEAVKLAPASAIARFKLARTLLKMRRYEESLKQFEELKVLAPDEANVHFMLGRVYKCMGRRAEAVRCLSGALGLDPKAAPLIKDAMEALGEEDEEMGDAADSDGEMD